MDGSISYNLNDLQTFDPITRTGINTNSILHTDLPNSSGDAVPLADADDSDVPNSNYPNRIIILGGTIHGSSQANLDTRIDAFKAIWTKRYKDLDIFYAGAVRRYTVMKANTVGVKRQDRALFATFTIELICKPFGSDITPTELLDVTGHTAATLTTAVTVEGTAPYQLPIITITITAKTGAGDYIQVTNDETEQLILIAGQALTAGDIVKIDPRPGIHAVTVNDEEVDYTGTFLELEPGERSFTITDGFTTRSINILIEYYKRYV